MNGTVLNKTELAAWRSLLARPDGKKLLLSAGIYLLAALIIPLSGSTELCGLFIAACVAFLLTATHSFSTLLAVAIPALLLFTLSGSMLPAALLFAIVFGGATGAVLILSARNVREALPLIGLPVLAYLAAWLISGHPLIALLTAVPMPLALVGALVVRRCKPFSPAVAAIAVAVAAVAVSVSVIALAAIAPEYLNFFRHLPELAALLQKEMLAVITEMAELYPEMGLTAIFTPTMLHNMIALAINLSPGIFAIFAIVAAYLVWRILCALLVALGMLPRLPRVFVTPMMSVVSAVLFILAFLVALFANSAYTLVGAVAENCALVLTPGFSLIGFGSLLGRHTQRSCLSVLLLIGMAYLIFNNPPLAFTIAALYGAIQSLLLAHANAKNNKNNHKKGEP